MRGCAASAGQLQDICKGHNRGTARRRGGGGLETEAPGDSPRTTTSNYREELRGTPLKTPLSEPSFQFSRLNFLDYSPRRSRTTQILMRALSNAVK